LKGGVIPVVKSSLPCYEKAFAWGEGIALRVGIAFSELEKGSFWLVIVILKVDFDGTPKCFGYATIITNRQ